MIHTACREKKKAAAAAADPQSCAAPAKKSMSKEAADYADTKLSFGRIEIEKGRPHFSQCVCAVIWHWKLYRVFSDKDSLKSEWSASTG